MMYELLVFDWNTWYIIVQINDQYCSNKKDN